MNKHIINIITFVILLSGTILFFRHHSYYPIILTIISAVFLLTLSFGILFLKFQYFLPAINQMKDRKVLLTFDDGPDPLLTPKILNILAEYDLTAVFFVVGRKAEQHPEVIRQIISNGHMLGNHTYHHSNFFSLHRQSLVEEDLQKCDAIIIRTTGHSPDFFRPPIGYTNPRIARAVRKLNKHTMGWRLRSYDSILKTPAKLLRRLTSSVRPGDIILLHDNLPQSAEVLVEFIRQSQKNGIIFASRDDIQALIR